MGPSIKYVTLVLANFDPSSLSNFVTHPGTSPKVRHTSRISPIFSRPSTKTLTTAPCTNSLSIDRGGFCPGFLSFVWKVLSVPPSVRMHVLQQKHKASLEISCFICMIHCFISVTSHAPD